MRDANVYINLLKHELEAEYIKRVHPTNPKAELQEKQYNAFAKIIRDTLSAIFDADESSSRKKYQQIGYRISGKTLRRFLKDEIPVSENEGVHGHRRNTLEKLTIFLGYKGFDNFIEQKDTEISGHSGKASHTLFDVVRNANEAEFRAYQTLPDVHVKDLEKHFITSESAYKRILNVLVRHKAREWVINNVLNPSAMRSMIYRLRSLKSMKQLC